jgi:hypothetical protein
VTVISEGVWHRRFASDPQILNKEIALNGESYAVVGIAGDSPFSVEQGPPPTYTSRSRRIPALAAGPSSST